MQVHYGINDLPQFQKAVITIGTFDGVHLGHEYILNQLKKEAAAIGGTSVLISFHPHPRHIVSHSGQPLSLLTTLEERILLLRKAGIDHLVIIPFTETFAKMDATSYVRDFLVRYFSPQAIIIGYDHRFGANRSGNFALLEQLQSIYRYQLKEIPAQVLEANAISSTRIREALGKGLVREARTLLGYPYFFEGLVVKGNQLGRTIGFPTANLNIVSPDKLIPSNGVYAVKATVQTKAYTTQENPVKLKGMMNIGIRPTVGGMNKVIEVNLFQFNQDIYDQFIRVELIDFIRNEQKFAGLDALKAQLNQDQSTAESILI
ncbi:MAG: bifunctional riboflavin kinase/FAD synthetase [Chitinophagaceae bacterium]|uniref:bifunctional riboflavin kinase/FAD synthetase n=1 Tax=unclassified Paraflavitalea TaxID=2798305 RepID=UPI003D32D78C|nr:bifunctional riboflavin kinase/FAD synthetase [Chitinophagaceae bacterium]